MTRTLPRLALLAVLALGTAACGSDDDADGSASSDPTTASASASAAESPASTESTSASADAEPTAAPADSQSVTAAGVTFAVPAGYAPISAEEVLGADAAADVVQELADRLGVSVEQLQQQFAQIDLFAYDPSTAGTGFADNVNLVTTDGTTLPTEDQVAQQYDALGFDLESTETVTTPAGDGLTTAYSGEAGGTAFSGRALLVPVGDVLATVTVSAGDADTADSVAALVASTLDAG